MDRDISSRTGLLRQSCMLGLIWFDDQANIVTNLDVGNAPSPETCRSLLRRGYIERIHLPIRDRRERPAGYRISGAGRRYLTTIEGKVSADAGASAHQA